MKKYLSLALAGVFALGFSSCNDNDNDWPDYYSFGTVSEVQSGQPVKIRKDAGAYLTLNNTNTHGMEVGDRIVVYYDVVGNFTEGGDNTIKFRGGYDIRTKDALIGEDVTEDEDAKLGGDGFLYLDPWYGGRYLNLDFTMYFSRGNQPHLISLVADTENYDGQTLTVVVRHNAYGDVYGNGRPLVYVDGIISFDLINLFEDMEIASAAEYPAKVVVKWEKYKPYSTEKETVTQELGKFVPWTVERPSDRTYVKRAQDSDGSLE